MGETKQSGAVQTYLTVIGRIVWLQLLFLGYTILGLGVLGFFPALLALMAVARQFNRETVDAPIHSLFWRYYKEMWVKGNLVGWPLFIVTLGVLWLTRHFQQLDGGWSLVGVYTGYAVLILLLILWVYALPTLIHLHITFFNFFRGVALLTLIRFFHTIAIGLIILGVIWIGITVSPIPAILLISSAE